MTTQSILVQSSIIYCMVHTYILLMLFYEYRCSRQTFIVSAVAAFSITGGASIWIMFTQGIAAMGQWGVLIAAIPTLGFFFLMSRNRNAQFFFIFALVDTVCMWLELTTALIDYAVAGRGVVTFALRILAFPLLEYVVWRWLRRPFLEVSRLVREGWSLFAIMTIVCYLILVLLNVYPILILERPQDMPLAVMVLALIALTYATIFLVLFEQLRVMKAQERQQVFEAQAVMMSRRMEEVRRSEEAMRIQRHDMRHQLQTVAALVKAGDTAKALDYVGASQASLEAVKPRSYCTDPVLNAVLVSATEEAQALDIRLELSLALPQELPVDALELSIVFANALENAIRAVKDLPADQRRVVCKSVTEPRLMMEIANPYAGEVEFDSEGLPVSGKPGHGIGTRSIVAFAEKYGALCGFRAEEGWFKVQLAV